MQSQFKMGAIAGFAASLAVAVLELINIFALNSMFTPFPAVLADMVNMPIAAGWVAHFAVGTLILGPAFAILAPRLPTDTSGTKGIVFAVGAWILMMITVAPAAGIGVFASSAGFGTIAWMLGLHLVLGVVLGTVYGELKKKARMAERAAATGTAAPV